MASTDTAASQSLSSQKPKVSIFEPCTFRGVSLTKYERVKVISQRIIELEENARPHIKQLPHETLFDVACKELGNGLLTHISVVRGDDTIAMSQFINT